MAQALHSIGLVAQLDKPHVAETLASLVEKLLQLGTTLRVEQALAAHVPQAEVGDRDFVLRSDAVITLGGDGTLLAVAREAAPLGTPVLGVDLGSFGFLADQPPEMVLERIDDVVAGRYDVETRMMLRAELISEGKTTAKFLALNDVVVAKEDYRHLVWVHCEVDSHDVATYPADGVIVATPTGSTAYSLSAGGPVVDPRVDCLLIVPICPHTLYSRPVVAAPFSVVKLSVERRPGRADEVAVTVDGQQTHLLGEGDCVVVQRADCRARLIRVGERSFFDRLRDKLNWDAPR